MQGTTVTLAERGGDPLLHRQDLAQASPGHGLIGGLQFTPDGLDQLISQHSDEQMPLGAFFLVMEHRTQAEFRFEAAEHRLEVGQHGIGVPQLRRLPGGFVAA